MMKTNCTREESIRFLLDIFKGGHAVLVDGNINTLFDVLLPFGVTSAEIDDIMGWNEEVANISQHLHDVSITKYVQ